MLWIRKQMKEKTKLHLGKISCFSYHNLRVCRDGFPPFECLTSPPSSQSLSVWNCNTVLSCTLVILKEFRSDVCTLVYWTHNSQYVTPPVAEKNGYWGEEQHVMANSGKQQTPWKKAEHNCVVILPQTPSQVSAICLWTRGSAFVFSSPWGFFFYEFL